MKHHQALNETFSSEAEGPSKEQMAALAALDRSQRIGADPSHFSF